MIHLFPSVLLWSCHYVYLRHRSVVAEIRTLLTPSACKANALTHCTTAAVHRKGKETVNCTFKKSMQGECMQVFQKFGRNPNDMPVLHRHSPSMQKKKGECMKVFQRFGRHRAISILTTCLYCTGTPHLDFYPM